MEKKSNNYTEKKNRAFISTLNKAQSGDKEAMMQVIDFYMDDIKYLSKFIKLPAEETMQTLLTELIAIVRKGAA